MLFFTFALALAGKVLFRKLAGIEFELPLALLTVIVAFLAGWMISPGKHSTAAFGEMGGLRMQRWGGGRYPEVARHVAA